MYYLIYLLGVVWFLAKGIGSVQRYLNYVDHITLAFVLGPCVLVLFCTRSFRAFAGGVAYAFRKKEDAVLRIEESLHAVRMVMEMAVVSGILSFLISTVNVFRALAARWTESDGAVLLLLDLSVALLPLFYMLVICMALLPSYYMLKKRLSDSACGAPGEKKSAGEAPEQPLKCVIVRELLQNYADGTTSGETGEDIRKHLQGCSGCRAFLENMKEAPPAEAAEK